VSVSSITVVNSTSVQVVIPTGVSSSSGTFSLVSPAGTATISTLFYMAPKLNVFPTAKTGDSVTLTGTYLDNVSSMTIGGAAVSITNKTSTSLSFKLGCGMSGAVVITPTYSSSTISAGSWTVTAAPFITSATMGTKLNVNGCNFSSTLANNKVYYLFTKTGSNSTTTEKNVDNGSTATLLIAGKVSTPAGFTSNIYVITNGVTSNTILGP
jgi:hypothetical protein